VRIVLGGLIGLTLIGFCLLGGGLAVVFRPEATLEGPCRAFLDRPKERWVKLSGCRLQIDELLVANDDAVERFADRAEGVSRTLYATPPVWTHAWAPLTTGNPDDHRAVRAVVRLVDGDVLKWVNAVERADEAQRKRLLENQSVLLRVAMPGLLIGQATRPPEAELLQTALGTTAQAGLLVIEPGPPPPPELPGPALAAGLLGFGVLLWTLSRLVVRRPHAADAAADVTAVDVSGVKLSLGELEEVRREEAEARKARRPPS
jgi:hypothetical protein